MHLLESFTYKYKNHHKFQNSSKTLYRIKENSHVVLKCMNHSKKQS